MFQKLCVNWFVHFWIHFDLTENNFKQKITFSMIHLIHWLLTNTYLRQQSMIAY